MSRLPETVSQQFNQLFAVIGQANDDLKMTIAEASMVGNFADVIANVENCNRLKDLEQNIRACLNNFANPSKPVAAEKNFTRRSRNRTRKSLGRLRVTIAGKVIEKNTIAETFFETLKVFDLDRVAKLNKVVTAIPLLSRKPATGYQAQRTWNGWHVTTHVNSHTATVVLNEISAELRMPIKVELING